jgi:hypothetical protein
MIHNEWKYCFKSYFKTVDSTYYAEYSNGTCSSLTRTANQQLHPQITFTATPTQPKCFGEKGSVV